MPARASNILPTVTVGDLVMTTAGDVTTVARRVTLGRATVAAWPVAALLAVVLGPVAVQLRGGVVDRRVVALAIAAAAGFGCLSVITLLALASDGKRWAFTSARPSVAGDGSGRADDGDRPTADVVDVAVEPVRLPVLSVTRPAVVAVEAYGHRHVLAVGRRRQMERVATALRAELNIGPDPLGRSAYPPRPRRVRVERQIGPAGVTVTVRLFHPLVQGCATDITFLASAAATFLVCKWHRFAFPPTTFGQVAWDAVGCVTYAAVAGVLWAIGRLLGRHRRLRLVRLVVDAKTYHPVVARHEWRTRRGAVESWPLDRVVGPWLTVRPGGRRADLSLMLDDHTSAPLIGNGRARDLRYACDTLAVALARRPPRGHDCGDGPAVAGPAHAVTSTADPAPGSGATAASSVAGWAA